MELGDWMMKGYFMRTEERLPSGHHVILLRMNPTQNRVANTPDIILNIDGVVP